MAEKGKRIPWTTISMIVVVMFGMVIWLKTASSASQASDGGQKSVMQEASEAAGVKAHWVRGPRDVINSVRDSVKASRVRLDTQH